MKSLQELNAEIALLEHELETVHGGPTEVYARIVGYYRSVRNWNKGKSEEFTHRKMFTEDNPKVTMYAAACRPVQESVQGIAVPARIEVYMRKGCPNCPPVCNYCRTLDTELLWIDTDTDQGAEYAAAHTIRSCPTVIAYTADSKEVARAYTLAEVRAWNVPEYTAKVANA